MPHEVWQLGPGDGPTFRGVNALFAAAFDDPDSYAAAPPSDDWLDELLATPHVIALAVGRGSDVSGALVAYELMKFEQARREIYIYDLAVSERMRRRGVATALIRHLQGMAARRGAYVIFVQADYEDPPAIALYEKLGTREEVLHFDIAPKG